MEKEIKEFLLQNEPDIPEENIDELLEDMKPCIMSALRLAFRGWNEGIEKRKHLASGNQFEKGNWKKYAIDNPTDNIDHILNHLMNVVNNDHSEEHLAHLISRCIVLSYGGIFPEYKGMPKKVILDGTEEGPDNLNEIEGEGPAETSYDGE